MGNQELLAVLAAGLVVLMLEQRSQEVLAHPDKDLLVDLTQLEAHQTEAEAVEVPILLEQMLLVVVVETEAMAFNRLFQELQHITQVVALAEDKPVQEPLQQVG
jgi:hypothetical protein